MGGGAGGDFFQIAIREERRVRVDEFIIAA